MSRVTDQQVRELRKEMAKHGCAEMAALRVGMHRNTARKYLNTALFPSDMKQPRAWRTREDPFEADWPAIAASLTIAPALEARTLFDKLLLVRPGVYEEGQLRTFQRKVQVWRAHNGPDKEVYFRQDHRPGEALQTDFTWATELLVTIQGQAFPHMLCHVMLPHSNWDWITVSQSESMLALRRGVPAALIEMGSVPEYHQTDNCSAATHVVCAEDEADEDAAGKPAGKSTRDFNVEYLELMRHYGMKPRTIGIGKSEQNGDVEASNGALKQRLNQHLLMRGHRDFPSVEAWETWAQEVCRATNKRRLNAPKELAVMKPLRVEAFLEFNEIDAKVTSESILVVKRNTYSVPPRLVGAHVKVRCFEMRLEVWHAQKLVLILPRLIGKNGHRIDYRHVIGALLQKAGAFARWRYREYLFPGPVWHKALAELQEALGERKGEVAYLRLLYLASKTMEADVEAALTLLLENGQAPTPDLVKELMGLKEPIEIPDLAPMTVVLSDFDLLTPGMLAEAV